MSTPESYIDHIEALYDAYDFQYGSSKEQDTHKAQYRQIFVNLRKQEQSYRSTFDSLWACRDPFFHWYLPPTRMIEIIAVLAESNSVEHRKLILTLSQIVGLVAGYDSEGPWTPSQSHKMRDCLEAWAYNPTSEKFEAVQRSLTGPFEIIPGDKRNVQQAARNACLALVSENKALPAFVCVELVCRLIGEAQIREIILRVFPKPPALPLGRKVIPNQTVTSAFESIERMLEDLPLSESYKKTLRSRLMDALISSYRVGRLDEAEQQRKCS